MRQRVLIVCEIVALIILSFVVCFFLYRGQARVQKQDVEDCVQDYENLSITLDTVNQDSDNIIIQGWAIIEGRNTEYFDTNVLLKSKKTGEYYRIATAFQVRTDVTEAYGAGEYTYDNSGFYAQAEKKRLPEKGRYEIYIQYNVHSDNILQATGMMVEV